MGSKTHYRLRSLQFASRLWEDTVIGNIDGDHNRIIQHLHHRRKLSTPDLPKDDCLRKPALQLIRQEPREQGYQLTVSQNGAEK